MNVTDRDLKCTEDGSPDPYTCTRPSTSKETGETGTGIQ